MSSCYFCGSSEDIEEHHIVPQRLGGTDKRTNTVDLCHDCHWKLERLYNKDFWEAIGIEDPRTTRETHVTCEYHGCTNQATDGYHVATSRDSGYVYRCDEHAIDETTDRNAEDGAETPDLRCLGEDSSPTFTRHVRYAFEDLLGNEPATQSEIREVFTSRRINYIGFPDGDENPVTEVRILADVGRFSASYTEGSWRVSYEGSRRSG